MSGRLTKLDSYFHLNAFCLNSKPDVLVVFDDVESRYEENGKTRKGEMQDTDPGIDTSINPSHWT